MRLFMYCVFDSASGVYDRPWVAQSDGSAIRSFGDIACDAEHPIGKHPEYYSLFRVGEFDDNTGVIVAETCVCIGMAHELVACGRVVDAVKLDIVDKEIGNAS